MLVCKIQGFSPLKDPFVNAENFNWHMSCCLIFPSICPKSVAHLNTEQDFNTKFHCLSAPKALKPGFKWQGLCR